MHQRFACRCGVPGFTTARPTGGDCTLPAAPLLPLAASAVRTTRRCHCRRRCSSQLLLLLAWAILLSAPVWSAQAQLTPAQGGNTTTTTAGLVTVVIRTGAQLAAAFANNSVQVALIPADVALVEEDWAPYAQPFVELNRNFTLLGTFPEKERWVTVDFGYNSAISPGGIGAVRSAKVRLMPGVTLTFRHMVVGNGRELPHFQYMGCDLITDSPPPPEGQAWPILLVDEGSLWQRSCLPLSLNGASANSIPRHPQIPGNQSAIPTDAPPPEVTGCTNNASAATMRRCWAASGFYTDLAMYAANADSFARPFRAGFILWFYKAPYICDVLMTDACVRDNGGFTACYYSIYPFSRRLSNGTALPPPRPPPPPPPPINSSTAAGANSSPAPGGTSGANGSPGGDDGSSESILGPVLGGVLGGVALLAAVAAILFMLVRRRRNRGAGSSAQQGGKQDTKDAPQKGCPPDQQLGSAGASSKVYTSGANTLGSSNITDGRVHESDAAAAEAAIRMLAASELALVPVTPLTPLLPGIPLDVKMGQGGGEVMLLPVVLGKGSYGRVVEGLYGGVRVAVKLLNRGLMADIFGEGVAVAVVGGGPPAAAPTAQRKAQECSLQEPSTSDQPNGTNTHPAAAAPGGCLASQPPNPAAVAGAADPPLSAAPQQPGVTPLQLPAQKSSPPLVQPQVAPGLQSSSGPQLPQTTPGIPAPADLMPAPAESDLLLQLQQQLNCEQQPLAAAARPLNLAALLWDSTTDSTALLSSLSSMQRTAVHTTALAAVAATATGTGGAGAAVPAAAAPNGAAGLGVVTSAAAALLRAPEQGVGEVRLELAPEPEKSAANGQPHSLRSVMRRTLAQEVEVLARMQHPNIIRLLAANLSPHSPCLVMERMDTSLDRVVHGGRSMAAGAGPMPLNKVLHIALHVARALAYLHPTIIHRDLKPGNVLISDPDSPTPIVKLADFGLSRLQDTVLVTARVDVGTAPYMAPETLNAQNCIITHHSDMYSYGIMLWEMLAGERPWQGLNMVQIAYVVMERGQQLPFSQLDEDRCPRALRALMQQCWDPVPERRPGASEVVKMIMLIMEKGRASAPGRPANHGSTGEF